MNTPRPIRMMVLVAMTLAAPVAVFVTPAIAQNTASSEPVQVDRTTTRVEMITKTSRLLQFDYSVPELVVDNQTIVRATPIAADKVLLTALKPGFAAITVSDADGQIQKIDVMVQGDVRALELALQHLHPNSGIRATALETGVVLTGTLARADDVPGVVAIAAEYFPNVHNHLKLPDSQLIAIEVQVYEVARTKVRQLGIDWTFDSTDVSLNVSGAGNPLNNLSFGVVNDSNRLNGFLQALERQNLARLLDKPVLVTQNGRPAEFLEGGEIPFEVSQGLGQVSIQFRPFGTKLDVVPIVQGEGTIRLEVRAEISEPSADLSNNSGVSGFRVRRVNTGVDMKIGHTLALAGDIREEVEATTSGIPGIMHTPYIGSLFRRVEETRTEIELVMLLTPRFVGEVDPSLLPTCLPGRQSASPSDCELFWKGHIEVPRCGPDCGGLSCQCHEPIHGQHHGFSHSISDEGKSPGQNGSYPAPATPRLANPSGFGFPANQQTPAPAARTSHWQTQKFIRR